MMKRKNKHTYDYLESEIEYYNSMGIKLRPAEIRKLSCNGTIKFFLKRPKQEMSIEEKIDYAYNDGKLDVNYMLDELDRIEKKINKYNDYPALRDMYVEEHQQLNDGFAGLLKTQAREYKRHYSSLKQAPYQTLPVDDFSDFDGISDDCNDEENAFDRLPYED